MLKVQKMRFVNSEHLSRGNNGWRAISSALRSISNPKGTNCHEWLDKAIKERVLEGDWAGFLHNPITYPEEYSAKYNQRPMPVSKLVDDEYFKGKLNSCRAIFVFTEQVQKFILENTGFPKVFALKHPSAFHGTKRHWERAEKVIHIGQQMRKYHSFANLNTKIKKVLIKPFSCEEDILEIKLYSNQYDIELIDQVNENKYIEMMCNSIVFLDLYDVAACNTIIECISLSVPILVNRLEGCFEYLGREYPMYYDDLNDAANKISDKKLIASASEYLKKMNKNHLSVDFFIRDLIYKC